MDWPHEPWPQCMDWALQRVFHALSAVVTVRLLLAVGDVLTVLAAAAVPARITSAAPDAGVTETVVVTATPKNPASRIRRRLRREACSCTPSPIPVIAITISPLVRERRSSQHEGMDLSAPEQALWSAFPRGEWADVEGAEIGMRGHGEVCVSLSRVAGRLIFEDAVLENPGGVALRLTQTETGADVVCDGVTAYGTLRLMARRSAAAWGWSPPA